MLLKYFYDDTLAHASYLVGCQRTREAIVIDPGRDIEPYLAVAKAKGMKIVAATETHIHADFVSGARELADRADAKLLLSGTGPEDWQYEFADQYEHQILLDGDRFSIGNIDFEVLQTAGHTPESISLVLTDRGGKADEPMGIFTGDFVFVGAIGRPDLLEEAAGIENSAEPGARQLFDSIRRFKELPDYLQVWPAHGAGSACGKGLGAIPSSTVGYEKRFNPALQYENEDEFVGYVLKDQPPAPRYFGQMKKVNKLGPALIGELPEQVYSESAELPTLDSNDTVLDIRSAKEFAEGHFPRAINIPSHMLAGWAGWIVNYDQPLHLIGSRDQIDAARKLLLKIGVEKFGKFFESENAMDKSLFSAKYEVASPAKLQAQIAEGSVHLIDVRSKAEWNAGHIEQATHRFLGTLDQQVEQIRSDAAGKAVVVQCQGGIRSAIACSILKQAGIEVINMTGGYNAWLQAAPASCLVPSR